MVRAAGRARNDQWGMPTLRYYNQPRKSPPQPLQMITRAEWDAQPPPPDNPGPRLDLPVRHIRYTFTRTPQCQGPNQCIPLIQEMQRNNLEKGLPDVMFNFLVGGDGLIYEGRGWDYKCTRDDDPWVDSPGPSINIAYIGTYEDTLAPWKMTQSGEHLRKWAQHHNLLVRKHEITPSLACYKEGEEVVDKLAEGIILLGLNKEQPVQPAPPRPARKRKVSDDEEEEEEYESGSYYSGSDKDSDGSDEVSDEDSDGSDEGSDEDSDGSDEGSDEDSDGSDEGSDEDSDDSDDGSDESSDDSDEGSDDDSDSSDEGSDEDNDDGSDVSSDVGSDDSSDEGNDSSDGSDDGSDDDDSDDFGDSSSNDSDDDDIGSDDSGNGDNGSDDNDDDN